MTTLHAPFLADILEHPEDDAPRLIYADYLEEHGDGARAEFIRLQCELAKYPATLSNDHLFDDRWHALRRRELAFLDMDLHVRNDMGVWPLWRDWIPAAALALVPGGAKYLDHLTFRRGFIEEVACTLEAWCGRGCPECGGRGCYDHAPEVISQGPFDLRDCEACHGIGRIDAHGLAVVRACPVRTVRLSSHAPNQHRTNLVGFGNAPPHVDFWAYNKAPEGTPIVIAEAMGMSYDSEETARRSLSATLIDWAHSALCSFADLPPAAPAVDNRPHVCHGPTPLPCPPLPARVPHPGSAHGGRQAARR